MDEHYEEVVEPEPEDEGIQTNLLPTNLPTVSETDSPRIYLPYKNPILKMDIADSIYGKLHQLLGVKATGKYYDLIILKDGGIYYKDINDHEEENLVKLSKNNGALKSIQVIRKILGDRRLEALGFFIEKKKIPTSNQINKSTPEETLEMANITERIITEIIDETSFTDNVDKDIQTIDIKGIDKGIQTNDQFSFRELKGLDKSMQTISGSLKKAVAEKRKTEQHIDMEYDKLKYLEKELTNTDDEKNEINNRIEKLKDRLELHNEEIKILKDRFSNQVTQIKETIKKLKNKTLGEKIRILFREQGITIATLLTAFGMTIGFIVELLIPKSVPSIKPTPKPTPTPTEPSWIKNKLEALKNLLAKLAEKAGAALPGIIGSVVSWILNRVKDVVGFIAEKTWILAVGIGVILIESIRRK